MRTMGKFKVAALAISLLGLIGCATQGGGQIDPIASMIVPKALYDYGPTLAANCQQACNVGACREYNFNMLTCADPAKFITAAVTGLPLVLNAAQIEAQGTAVLTMLCTANGYTPAMPAAVVAGNCPLAAK